MDKDPQEEVSERPLFSSEERRQIVLRFVEAYIGGAVTIIFPTEEQLRITGEHEPIPRIQSLTKEYFATLVMKATGSTALGGRLESMVQEVTGGKVSRVIDELFFIIIQLREAKGRLGGQFIEYPRLERDSTH